MKYLIWDFDGTLAHRIGMWSGAILKALEAETPGHGMTVEQIRPFLLSGFPWHEPHKTRAPNVDADAWWKALEPIFVKTYIEAARIDGAQAHRLCARVREEYVNPANWRLYDDVVPCLNALSADGWKHVILSNHVPELRGIIQALDAAPNFEAIFNSAETGIEKPNPLAFRNVLAYLGETKQVWMIGDSITADVNGARAVGLRSVLVRKPHAEADVFCDSLRELPAILSSGSQD